MMDFTAARSGRDNTTCAGDLAALMSALGAGRGIRPEVTARVLAGLGRYLPPGVTALAGKQGDLAAVRHDAALVEREGTLTALAVMSCPAAAPDGLARLAARALEDVSVL